MNISINDEEKDLLMALLRRNVSESLIGIHHARKDEFKAMLKKEAEVAETLLAKLSA